VRFKVRAWDKRFNDPAWSGDVAKPRQEHMDAAIETVMGPLRRYHVASDPRDGDGKKTVIIHGKRVSEDSPKQRWPSAELWGVTRCNVVYWRESLTDWDRWFDLHPKHATAHHRGILAKRPEAWDWYTRQDASRPIYLLETDSEVPASVAFPRQQVQAAFGGHFTVSVDWMIALALLEGCQRIVLNGIGTRMEPDYQYAHKGILYWIGFARGRGVEVIVDQPSCYADPAQVYGYECGAPEWQAPEPVGV
jgi:hypothetical protein